MSNQGWQQIFKQSHGRLVCDAQAFRNARFKAISTFRRAILAATMTKTKINTIQYNPASMLRIWRRRLDSLSFGERPS